MPFLISGHALSCVDIEASGITSRMKIVFDQGNLAFFKGK
jgi:hypothetical protein